MPDEYEYDYSQVETAVTQAQAPPEEEGYEYDYSQVQEPAAAWTPPKDEYEYDTAPPERYQLNTTNYTPGRGNIEVEGLDETKDRPNELAYKMEDFLEKKAPWVSVAVHKESPLRGKYLTSDDPDLKDVLFKAEDIGSGVAKDQVDIAYRDPAKARTGSKSGVNFYVSGEGKKEPEEQQGQDLQIENGIDENAPYMANDRKVAPRRIIMHGDVNEDAEALLRYGRQVDTDRGFAPGYHFYIAKDGRVIQGAPVGKITNHTLGENGDSIGINIAGADEGKMPTPAQEKAAERLIAQLAKQYGISPMNVVGHGELQPNRRNKLEGGTVAANTRANGFYQRTDEAGYEYYSGGTGETPPSRPSYPATAQEAPESAQNRRGQENRQRLTSAIEETEQAGYKVPHKIGTPDEPEGDQSPGEDMENLVAALKKQEKDAAENQKKAISQEREYWEDQIKRNKMTAEQAAAAEAKPDPKKPLPLQADPGYMQTISDALNSLSGVTGAANILQGKGPVARGLMQSGIGIEETVNRFTYAPVVHTLRNALEYIAPGTGAAKFAAKLDDSFKAHLESDRAAREGLQKEGEKEGAVSETIQATAKMGGDLSTIMLTGGLLPELKVASTIAEKLIHGAASMTEPALQAGADAAAKAAKEGKSETQQFLASVAATAEMLTLGGMPMHVTGSVAGRAAKMLPVAAGTVEAQRGLHNLLTPLTGEERQPFSAKNLLTQGAPLVLMGTALGGKGEAPARGPTREAAMRETVREKVGTPKDAPKAPSIVGKTIAEIAPADITKDRKAYIRKRRAEGASLEQASEELKAESDRITKQVKAALPTGSQIHVPGQGVFELDSGGTWNSLEGQGVKQFPGQEDTVVRVGKGEKPAAEGRKPVTKGIKEDKIRQSLGIPPEIRHGPFREAHHGTSAERLHETGFSDEAIGQGTGGQVQGYGHYVAEGEGTAKYYREVTTRDKGGVTVDGKPVQLSVGTAEDFAHYAVAKVGHEQALKDATDRLSYAVTMGDTDAMRWAEDKIDAIQKLKGKDVKVTEGAIYNVRVLGDEANYLDWDKPLKEQSEDVQAVLKEALDPIEKNRRTVLEKQIAVEEQNLARYKGPEYAGITPGGKENLIRSAEDQLYDLKKQLAGSVTDKWTGKRIYEQLVEKHGSDKAASAWLASKGILGNRYLDAESREAGQRLLDPVRKDILEKYRSKLNQETDPEVRKSIENKIKRIEVEIQQDKNVPLTRNYVVFNPKNIVITKRNGEHVSKAEAVKAGVMGAPEGSIAAEAAKIPPALPKIGATPLTPTQAKGFAMLAGGRKQAPSPRSIKPIYKNPIGLYEGTAATLEKFGFPVLANRLREYSDTRKKYGAFDNKFRVWSKGISKGDVKIAEHRFGKYWEAVDNGDNATAQNIYNSSSAKIKEVIDIWKSIAVETGQIAQRGDLHVKAPDGWRPIKPMGDRFFPRRIKPEWLEVMRNPDKNPEKFAQIRADMVKKGMNPEVVDNYVKEVISGLDRDAGSLQNIEHARTSALPTRVYDYSFETARNYIASFADEMAKTEAFGQSLGKDNAPAFDAALKQARDDPSREYINELQDDLYGKRSSGWKRAGQVGRGVTTASFLGNVASTARNLHSGVMMNLQASGIRQGVKDMVAAGKAVNLVESAYEKGILHSDIANMQTSEVTQATRELSRLTDRILASQGYKWVEEYTRALAYVGAQGKLRTILHDANTDPLSNRSQNNAAFVQRMGIEPQSLIDEGGSGPLTDRFYRQAVADVQGGYTIADTPLYLNNEVGKTVFHLQKWGTQNLNYIDKNVINPFLQYFRTGRHETVNLRDKNGNLVNSRVPGDWKPIIRYLLLLPAFGLVQKEVEEWVLGIPDKEASFAEILQRVENRQALEGFGLLISKLFQASLNVGMLGTVGNLTKSLLMAGPEALNPPPLQILKTGKDFAVRLIQEGALTEQNVRDTLNKQFSILRVSSKMLAHVPGMSEQSQYLGMTEKKGELSWLRSIEKRFAQDEGLAEAPKFSGTFASGPMRPFYNDLEERLLLGDADGAQAAIDDQVKDMTAAEEKSFRASLKKSVMANRPISVAGSKGEAVRDEFLYWVDKNQPAGTRERIEAIDDTYRDTAADLGLFAPKKKSARDIAKKYQEFKMGNVLRSGRRMSDVSE